MFIVCKMSTRQCKIDASKMDNENLDEAYKKIFVKL